MSEVRYAHGVIDDTLVSSGAELPPDTALQDPADYLDVLYRGIPEALEVGGVKRDEVIGIGVDFTCCTVLPVLADGTPLCQLEEWRDHLHAWVKLWKHHSAQPVADRLNEVALARGEGFLARYGGRLSSEWYFPKLIEIWQKDRPVYDAMSAFVEATDWIVWQMTGRLARELLGRLQGLLVGAATAWRRRSSSRPPIPAFPTLPTSSGRALPLPAPAPERCRPRSLPASASVLPSPWPSATWTRSSRCQARACRAPACSSWSWALRSATSSSTATSRAWPGSPA